MLEQNKMMIAFIVQGIEKHQTEAWEDLSMGFV